LAYKTASGLPKMTPLLEVADVPVMYPVELTEFALLPE
jgi:hypothetical protein